MTLAELADIQAAYAERLFREIELPALKAGFGNVTDDACKDIIREDEARRRGTPTKKSPTLRDKAFKILAQAITPAHMLEDDEQPARKAPVQPLEGISQSAARGIVKAVDEGLVRPHALWIQLAGVFPSIKAAAEQRSNV